MTSILQAKVLHQHGQRDAVFARTAVSLQGSSTQVNVLQIIESLLDQLTQVEGIATAGQTNEALKSRLDGWV